MAIRLMFGLVGVSVLANLVVGFGDGCFGGGWVSLVGCFGDFILALNIIK